MPRATSTGLTGGCSIPVRMVGVKDRLKAKRSSTAVLVRPGPGQA